MATQLSASSTNPEPCAADRDVPQHACARFAAVPPPLPQRKSRIVIIGGGVIGCSIAYHLAKRGERDVVLLERLQLTHGATWHAAGLVGQLRSSSNLTRLMRYSAELYGRLEAETGQATGWHGVGSLRLASSPARWQELKRSATMAKGFGFHVDLVGAARSP